MTTPEQSPDDFSGHQFRRRFEQARMIVDAYARFLETSGPLPGQVMDISSLPCEKGEIRRALLLCLNCNLDTDLQADLEAGFLLLSAFQDGVGTLPAGEVFAALDLDACPREINAYLAGEHDAFEPWRKKARTELQRLRREVEQIRSALNSSPC